MLGEYGFLRPYDHILETGDTQNMWWYPSLPYSKLTRPFCISDTEKAEHRHDVFTGNTKPRKLAKNELIDRLHDSGVLVNGRNVDIVGKKKTYQ